MKFAYIVSLLLIGVVYGDYLMISDDRNISCVCNNTKCGKNETCVMSEQYCGCQNMVVKDELIPEKAEVASNASLYGCYAPPGIWGGVCYAYL